MCFLLLMPFSLSKAFTFPRAGGTLNDGHEIWYVSKDVTERPSEQFKHDLFVQGDR